MMQGTIRRIALHRIDPRTDTRLPSAWIGGAQPSPARTAGAWLTRGLSGAPRAGEDPVLVLLGTESADARAELVAHAASGARVYALVGPSWGKDQAESQALQAPGVLVRRVSEVPATGVHATTGARLWVGGGFVLRLDDDQAEGLRQTFLRLFWHEATEEAWSSGRQLVWRPALERPFDVPEAPASALVRLERPDSRLAGEVRGALVHLVGGVPPETTPRRLWFPAGPEHQDRLSKLAQAGVEVVWRDWGLPDLLVAGGSGEMLLPGKLGRLRVRLAPGQADEVGRLLETDGNWRFQTNVRLGDPSVRQATFWLPGEGAGRELEAEQIIEVPDVPASALHGVRETAPASLPAAQPLALAVRYQWTVVPPRLPTGTEEDAIVGRWRKLDEIWTSRLARVHQGLLSSEGDRSRIGRAFSRLVSSMLGFERTHRGLIAQVTDMESKRPSAAGPSAAPALLSLLDELEEKARKLQGDLDEAERRAREDEEREKQEAVWRGRVASAEHDLPLRRSELAEQEEQESRLVRDLEALEEEMKTADKKARKDIKARKHRLGDERTRASRHVQRLRDEVAGHQRTMEETFAFSPPAKLPLKPSHAGSRFVPTAPKPASGHEVPDEALPEVGQLRRKKQQRYLVIHAWEELAAGEQSAARLAAELVAPENT